MVGRLVAGSEAQKLLGRKVDEDGPTCLYTFFIGDEMKTGRRNQVNSRLG